MKDLRTLVEIGIETSSDITESIGRAVMEAFPDCNPEYCEEIIGSKNDGWTVGVVDEYMPQVCKISKKFPHVLFTVNSIDNYDFTITKIREGRELESRFLPMPRLAR